MGIKILTPLCYIQNCNQSEKLYGISLLLIRSGDCNFMVPGCHFQNLLLLCSLVGTRVAIIQGT